MQTYQTIPASFQRNKTGTSYITTFLNWCAGQEPYRFGWLAAIIAFHGCILAPITLMCVVTAGNNMVLWSLTTVSMAMCLFTNLAAMPTKITIPVFFMSLLINAIVIGISMQQMFL